ncbi:MAG: helicase-related protein, partial [Bdellovibrionaceae bacterium]|nr:helicase-related protein [Pseudobdellovibrionaceae bacterium]
HESKRSAIHQFIREQLLAGRQAYVIYPLVEESEVMQLKNATVEYQRWQELFSDFKVGLLHGRMKAEEKDQIMRAFKNGQLHILVATSVIEVGIDVPNAIVIMIEHAERFGLAAL